MDFGFNVCEEGQFAGLNGRGTTFGTWCKKVCSSHGHLVSRGDRGQLWHLQRMHQEQLVAAGVTVHRRSDAADIMHHMRVDGGLS